METPDASDGSDDPERLMAPMQMGKSVPILDRVSREARPALAAAIARTGMPMEHFDRMHIWAVAFTLAGFDIAREVRGDDADAPVALSGAEQELGAAFRKRKRRISGVETMEQQIGFFASMPIGAQRRFLEMTVGGGVPAEAATETPEVAAAAEGPSAVTNNAWVQGDVDAIAAEMGQMPAELYDVLLTRRNRNWTAWLERRLEQPGTVLFAVGAGHLAGPESVQVRLAERGLQARRIH